MGTISTHDYFRSDLQDQLPASEVLRRRLIRERIEGQYRQWLEGEQQRWHAITQPGIISFLGVEWHDIPPSIQVYLKSPATSFAILSDLQLSTIQQPDIVTPNEDHSDHNWLYKQQRRYAISIYDFGYTTKEYQVPLIEVAAVPSQDLISFEAAHPDTVSSMLPIKASTFRVISFPQTRFSFIEDEIFQALYPLPEEEVKVIANKLLNRFQGPAGYYNGLASPFTEAFRQPLYNGKVFPFFAAVYPVIDLEFVGDYKRRKESENFVSRIQRQSPRGYPVITQWRYSRRFDFAEEIQNQVESLASRDWGQSVQSARGLFEYSCGELNTLELDLGQVSLLEQRQIEPQNKCLLQVDPLWLLVFTDSNTICAFRNEGVVAGSNSPFKDLKYDQTKSPTWCEVLLNIIKRADECMGSYEPTYRTRLAGLQFRVHQYKYQDYTLIKDLSDFVAEITILLDPLLAQVNILRKWQQWYMEDVTQTNYITNLFQEAISTREAHLNSLKRLQEQAKQSLDLLFQLSSIETAHQQSEAAKKMAQETRAQLDLAYKADRQNNAILIFTIITVVFLPLSFFTSYFGMDASNVRDTSSQGLFWAVAGPLSFLIIASAMAFAFRANLDQYFRSSRSDMESQGRLSGGSRQNLGGLKQD